MYDFVHTNELGARVVAGALYERLRPELLRLAQERRPVNILGISAFYHDSRRLPRASTARSSPPRRRSASRARSTTPRFPTHAVDYCLARGAASAPASSTTSASTTSRSLKFERLLETYLRVRAARASASFRMAMPLWLKEKLLHAARDRREGLGGAYRRRRCVFTEHHETHAASAFFPSPFEEAAILTLDGVGEWATTHARRRRGQPASS